jgi:hypothetical protein
MNDERMLETDFEAIKKLKTNDQSIFENWKRYESSSAGRSNNFITCAEIESLTGNKDKKNQWTTMGNKGRKVEPKMDSQLYLAHLIASARQLVEQNDGIHSLIEAEQNINRLDFTERYILYRAWLDRFADDQEAEIDRLRTLLDDCSTSLRELRLQEDRSIMEDALIIAMTTTGSSRYHRVLKDIGPRVVIVEEAAEVFESHIVAALSKHCEHLILIGDHVQLRPNPAVYLLAQRYQFDVSLFERLLNNNIKKVMLKCQHRMRSEISVLMRHFYNEPVVSSIYACNLCR